MSHPQATEKTSLRREVQEVLKQQDAKSIYGSLGKLIGGIAIFLVTAVVLATVLRFALETPVPWIAWFAIVLLPVGLWLYLLEKRAHDEYTVAALNAPKTAPDLDAPVKSGGPVAALTWAPRTLLDGLAGVRGKWHARQNNVFRRAAQLLLELAKYDGGVGMKFLVHPPENMVTFMAAVKWLDDHDWIGKSSDGQKMWLSSGGKKKLEEGNMMPHRSVKAV